MEVGGVGDGKDGKLKILPDGISQCPGDVDALTLEPTTTAFFNASKMEPENGQRPFWASHRQTWADAGAKGRVICQVFLWNRHLHLLTCQLQFLMLSVFFSEIGL
jgi:hypothetical protein